MRLFSLAVVFLMALSFVPVFAQQEYTCYDMQVHNTTRVDLLCIVVGQDVVSVTSTATPVVTTVTPVATPTTVDPVNRVVPDQFATISAAVYNIPNGSTVYVRAGTYKESVLISSSNITLNGDIGAIVDGECSRDSGIQIQGSDVTVTGFTVQNTTGPGIMVDGYNPSWSPSREIITNNTIVNFNCSDMGDAFAAGVSVYYGGSGMNITGNTIVRRTTAATAVGKGDGIWFKSSSQKPSGGGHTIANNTIFGGWDGIGGEVEYDIHGTFDKNTTITGNSITRCGDDGIQVEGGGQNILVKDNVIRECGIGIALATPLTGPLTVDHNTIVSGTVGTLGSHACFKVGNDTTSVINITNNNCTISGPGGSGIQQTNSGSGIWRVSNNAWNVNGYMFNIAYDPPRVGSIFNGDCFVANDPSRFIKWASSIQVLSLAAFQGMGYELNGKMGTC